MLNMAILKTKRTLSAREGQLQDLDTVLKDETLKISRAHEVMAILAESLLDKEECLSSYEGNAFVPSTIIEEIFTSLTE